MAMSRGDALTYVSGVLAEWLTRAGIAATDAAATMGAAIDDALLDVGVAYADRAAGLPDTIDTRGFRAALRLRGLQRIRDAIAPTAFDLKAGDLDLKRSQLLTALGSAIAEAEATAAPYTTDAGFAAGSLSLGALEPWPPTF